METNDVEMNLLIFVFDFFDFFDFVFSSLFQFYVVDVEA